MTTRSTTARKASAAMRRAATGRAAVLAARKAAVLAVLAALATGPAWQGRATAQEAADEADCDCRLFDLAFGGWQVPHRPMLGVTLDTELDRRLETVGARVADILRDGPAGEAGIREGDVIVSVDGHALSDALDDDVERLFDDDRSFPAQRLVALARELDEGEPVEVVVERDGEARAFTVTPRDLAERDWPRSVIRYRGPGPQAMREYRLRMGDVAERMRDVNEHLREMDRSGLRDHARWQGPVFRLRDGSVRGLDLVELNADLGAYFGTKSGVLVADVDGDSGLGLRPGDVVSAVGGREIEDVSELRRVLRSYREGEEIEFRIWRDGAETTVTGTIE